MKSIITAAGLCSRQLALERIKLRAPDLSFERDHYWKKVRDDYCNAKNFRRTHLLNKKAHIGAEFIHQINGLLERLGVFYKGPTVYNVKKKGGDPKAFEDWFKTKRKQLMPPRTATVLSLG